MSLARYDGDERDHGTKPMVALAHAREARKHNTRARDPRHADELGAVAVVDLLDCGDPSHKACGGRIAFFRIAGTDSCSVVRLPRLTK